MQPSRDADAEQAAHAQLVVVVMVAVVVVVMPVGVHAPVAQAGPRAPRTPTTTTSSAETRFSHGIQLLREDERESASVTRPSAKTPIVCVTVTVSPRRAACFAVPLRPDEVGGDDRLAVPGAERVDRAPEEGEQERERDEPCAQLLAARSGPRSRRRSHGAL